MYSEKFREKLTNLYKRLKERQKNSIVLLIGTGLLFCLLTASLCTVGCLGFISFGFFLAGFAALTTVYSLGVSIVRVGRFECFNSGSDDDYCSNLTTNCLKDLLAKNDCSENDFANITYNKKNPQGQIIKKEFRAQFDARRNKQCFFNLVTPGSNDQTIAQQVEEQLSHINAATV